MAQQPPTSVQIIPAGQVELARLVDLAAQRLRLNVQYQPELLKGSVTLRLEGPLSDRQLWDVANDALAAAGLTTVRAGDGTYKVVKLAEAASLTGVAVPTGAPELQKETSLAGFQTVVLRVRYRSAKEIAEAMKLVVSKTGGAAGELGPGLLMVSDLQARLEQVQRVVALLDVPAGHAMTEEVPLRNVAAVPLVALAQQITLKRESVSGEKIPGELIAGSGGGSVFIVSPAEHADSWRALVGQLDKREPVESVVYTPRYFGVREVGQLIEQVVRASAPGAAGALGAGGGGDERWRLVLDELTGTLIVTATPAQHERIKALMERLDSVPAAARRPVRAFKVRNRDVNELAQVLRELVVAGALEAGTSEAEANPAIDTASLQRTERPLSTVPGSTPLQGTSPPSPPSQASPPKESPQSAAPPTAAATPQAGARSLPARSIGAGDRKSSAIPVSDVVITADQGTATIIAIGEPRLLAQLEALIKTLDVRQPQVMLEVLLVSLSDTQALNLGVELERIEIHGETATRLSSLFGLSSSDFAGSARGGSRSAADAPGFTGIVLNPGEFAVVVRALEVLGRGRSLSIPKVLVGNNQQAVFSSVLQQPILTTNASTTVTTTSFGGTQDAGTSISIKPQIADGDHLVLSYSVALSSFVGSPAAQGLPPPRQQNSVQSQVSIPDGFTVVVGGLELATDSKSVTQVPLLGSIPVLGELFKDRSISKTNSRFFVFIRANVLRHTGFEDLKYLSALDAGAARIDTGWPVVEPRLIR